MKSFITHKNLYLGLIGLGSVLITLAEHKVEAQIVDLNDFCQKFPQNSRCEGYISSNSNNLPVNSQTLIVQLETVGSDAESILIEVEQETIGDISLSVVHVERFEGEELLSGLLNGGVEAVASGIPIPFDVFEFYESVSTRPEYLAFTPDSCQIQPSLFNDLLIQDNGCSIIGTDNLSLSEKFDIRSGTFTIGYSEGALVRLIAFRIRDHNTEFANALETDRLCQSYPLNSHCRYWPISQDESLEE
ncbi:MAG: hypothetical protein AAGD09_19045 [Cyanobacteria bacterium P01_F01_bin.56]